MQNIADSGDIEVRIRLLLGQFPNSLRLNTPYKYWLRMCDNRLWEEIVLCILSSNINFETAYSALLQLINRELIDYNSFTEITPDRILKELRRSIYLPKKRNDEFRVYRYPSLRAKHLYKSGLVIRDRYGGLHILLAEFDEIDELRAEIVRFLPGIGMKEASMFLKNIGFSDRLAVLDSHVMRFLFPDFYSHNQKRILSQKAYLNVERKFLDLSDKIGISPRLLDSLLWHYAREGTY